MSGKLLDALYATFKADVEFMSIFGLTSASPPEEITKKIVRGVEPDKPLTPESVPMVLVYIVPGRYGRNQLVFEGKFCIECYGKTSHQARQVADRAFELLHDKRITANGFNTFRCLLAYDDDFATGITGIKGYKAIYDVDYVRTI